MTASSAISWTAFKSSAKQIGIHGRALAFTLSLSLLTGVLFGLAPALGATRPEYPEDRQAAAFYQQVVSRIEALPGVRAAAAVSRAPITGSRNNPSLSFAIEGRAASRDKPWAQDLRVSPGYFRAMGIPLLRGRLLSEQDAAGAPAVVLIGETAARRYWPGDDPVGSRIQLEEPGSAGRWVSIVGVVGGVGRCRPIPGRATCGRGTIAFEAGNRGRKRPA